MPLEAVSLRGNDPNVAFSWAPRQSKNCRSLRSAIAFNSGSETNQQVLRGIPSGRRWVKDAYHRAIVNSEREAVNPHQTGTNACLHYHYVIPPAGSVVLRLRLRQKERTSPRRSTLEQADLPV
jgi:hypothetical protein